MSFFASLFLGKSMLADSGPALQLSPEITYWSFAQSFSLPQGKKKVFCAKSEESPGNEVSRFPTAGKLGRKHVPTIHLPPARQLSPFANRHI